MKLVLSTLAVLASSVAFACPDLSGTYACDDNGEKSTIAITQSGVNFHVVTTGADWSAEQDIIADGKMRNGEPDENFKTLFQVAKCNDTVLAVLTQGETQDAMIVSEEMAVSRQGADLSIAVRLKAVQNGQTHVQDSTIVCTAK